MKELSEFTDRSEPHNETPTDIAERLGVPLIGGKESSIPITEINKPIGVCAKCGLTLHGTMMYSCQNDGCPTGLGRIVSMNTQSFKGIDG
jgi:hypothetical protein